MKQAINEIPLPKYIAIEGPIGVGNGISFIAGFIKFLFFYQ